MQSQADSVGEVAISSRPETETEISPGQKGGCYLESGDEKNERILDVSVEKTDPVICEERNRTLTTEQNRSPQDEEVVENAEITTGIGTALQECPVAATELPDHEPAEELDSGILPNVTQPDIAFFDLAEVNVPSSLIFHHLSETTIPADFIIEFACVILDGTSLHEKNNYRTFVHCPPNMITEKSISVNHIGTGDLVNAPSFDLVADRIYSLMNGLRWAGHNILSFDIPHLNEEYARLDRDPPVPHSVIDTYPLLRDTFGTRAGDMKLASLGRHFALGEEKHRALEDVRMNIEVLKLCSTIVFLEQHDLLPHSATPFSRYKRTPSSSARSTKSNPHPDSPQGQLLDEAKKKSSHEPWGLEKKP